MNDQLLLLYDFAFGLAEIAYQNDEVPVGAVIFKDNTYEVGAPGFNQMKSNKSSLDHAEMLALRLAMSRMGKERLIGYSMITTLEPCPMCAQAISFARLTSIIFSAEDKKSGGILHGPKIYNSTSCHHKPSVIRLDDNDRSKKLLQRFFQNKRTNRAN
jgi:tRNA(Arg) A34 adenosine deaminase TadA|tara:strand:- start:884 stop:1357 length:474 start_codon:yes stop_codon:yes gene_type:complete